MDNKRVNSYLYTPQEWRIIGGTPPTSPEANDTSPYTPLYRVAALKRGRDEIRFFTKMGLKPGEVLWLEPLDAEGNTTQDPRVFKRNEAIPEGQEGDYEEDPERTKEYYDTLLRDNKALMDKYGKNAKTNYYLREERPPIQESEGRPIEGRRPTKES